jgi:UrcA family protein
MRAGALLVVGSSAGAAYPADEDTRAVTGEQSGQRVDYRTYEALVAPEISIELEEPAFDAPSLGAETESEISVTPGEIKTMRSPGASAVVLESLSRPVSYADLDLVFHSDVLKLQYRVERMAKAICDKLHAGYPFTISQSDTCVRKALREASSQIQDAIARAEERASVR